MEVFDPATEKWEEVAPMPTARTGLAVGVVDGKLYAVGGYNLAILGYRQQAARLTMARASASPSLASLFL